MSTRPIALALALGIACAAAWAQAVPSGPPEKEPVPPLPVFAATGPYADREVDFPAERKNRLTVYVFVHYWARPTAAFLRELDAALRTDPDLHVCAAFPTNEPRERREYLPIAQRSLQLQATSFCVPKEGGENGPPRWNLAQNLHVTIVIVQGGIVRKSWGMRSVNGPDAKSVVVAVRAIQGKS